MVDFQPTHYFLKIFSHIQNKYAKPAYVFRLAKLSRASHKTCNHTIIFFFQFEVYSEKLRLVRTHQITINTDICNCVITHLVWNKLILISLCLLLTSWSVAFHCHSMFVNCAFRCIQQICELKPWKLVLLANYDNYETGDVKQGEMH